MSVVRIPGWFFEEETNVTKRLVQAVWDIHVVFPFPTPIAAFPSKGAHASKHQGLLEPETARNT